MVRPSARLLSSNLADARPNVGSASATSISRQLSTTQAITPAPRREVRPSNQPWREGQAESAGRNPAWPSPPPVAGLELRRVPAPATRSATAGHAPRPVVSPFLWPFQPRSCRQCSTAYKCGKLRFARISSGCGPHSQPLTLNHPLRSLQPAEAGGGGGVHVLQAVNRAARIGHDGAAVIPIHELGRSLENVGQAPACRCLAAGTGRASAPSKRQTPDAPRPPPLRGDSSPPCCRRHRSP